MVSNLAFREIWRILIYRILSQIAQDFEMIFGALQLKFCVG
ncbi:hypothetical protein CAMRE0001_1700 [Campylobacter rectus RM3267]|uniref:Uncharacterized protein n=1 Tax=Campylobacter rectus RM3267 TaxID=553218 RepID=B9CZB4_CAMRE|nr:hypothetical protein CAMRE0001_1700 [Campylobacter rectus RM3267]